MLNKICKNKYYEINYQSSYFNMTQKSIEEIKKNINALQDKYKDITLVRINLTKKSIKETKEKLFNIKTK